MRRIKWLYKFAIEGDDAVLQTSHASDITHNSETYKHCVLSHSEVTIDDDVNKNVLKVNMDATNEISERFFDALDRPVITLTLTALTKNGPEIFWKGRLKNITQGDGEQREFIFGTTFSSLKQPGLAMHYQTINPVAHYGPECGLDAEDWRVDQVVTDIDGNDVTVTDLSMFDDGQFTGGFIRYAGYARGVISHSGSVLTISRPFPTLTDDFNSKPSVSIACYPGCDHSPKGCAAYSNFLNYRGWPWLAGRNPFKNAVN